MATGTVEVNFGAFPGDYEKTVDVTGVAGFTSTSLLEVWVMPIATATHTVDEHLMERIRVQAYYLSAGSFRVVAQDNSGVISKHPNDSLQPRKRRLYGSYTIGWATT